MGVGQGHSLAWAGLGALLVMAKNISGVCEIPGMCKPYTHILFDPQVEILLFPFGR